MIFSRTASTEDTVTLDVRDNLLEYLRLPVSLQRYSTPLIKFWEYSILLKLIDYYELEHKSILSITENDMDVVLDDIAIEHRLNFTQLDVERFLKLPIKINKYDIIASFGTLTTKNQYKILEKTHKHLNVGGYLIITIEELTSGLTDDDLITISFFMENFGYDFCSDEEELIHYTNESKLHSLVMQRLSN